MAYGVFIHRFDSVYNDVLSERYHFPRSYLRRVEACVGYWVLYYEPSKIIGTRGYFAAAKVQNVVPDPEAATMFYAVIEPGSYVDFAATVPFRGPSGLVETGLLNNVGRISGRAQSAVRPISAADFNRIVNLGLDVETHLLPRETVSDQNTGFEEDQAPYETEVRDRVNLLTSRVVRDRVFRSIVLKAYGERCAVTGLKLINGGGRAEVSAAHIQPVEHNGPDLLSNGLSLSGTAHWMFDRGLIGISDDLTILVSRQANDPDGVKSLINPTGKLIGPLLQRDRPHPQFLNWHRGNCFKQ